MRAVKPQHTMTIGISGPVDINLLNCEFGNSPIPETNSFPLTAHLVNALLRRGYHVIVYTNSGSIDVPVVLQNEQVTVCVGCTKSQPGRRFFNYERQQLKQLMQQYPADIIYAFWTYEYAWAALSSGIPTVVSVHDIAYKILLTQFDAFRFVRWIMNMIVLRRAKWVVANSAYTYKQLSRSVQAKATIIDNFYTPYLSKLDTSTITKGNYIVSVVMGFTKRKGVPRALHAFARLRKKWPDLRYQLIGVDMEPNGAAYQYAAEHQLLDGVDFMGPLPHQELIHHVAAAKLLLHPSVEESFGMAVLEAMVLKTPVIGGKKSGFVPYLLDFGRVGELCNIKSEEEMAQAADRLLQDQQYADKVAQHAYRFAQENFSEDVIVHKFISMCAGVLGKPDARPQHQKRPAQLGAAPLIHE